jgi:hypothetical protein
MTAVIYVRTDNQFQGTEMIQANLLNGQATLLNANIVGYCFKNEALPAENLQAEIKSTVSIDFDSLLIQSKDIISSNLLEVFNFVTECSLHGISVYTLSDGNLTKVIKEFTRGQEQNNVNSYQKLQ